MRKFSNLIVNEWVKLAKKRSFAVPFLIVIAVSVLLGYVAHLSGGTEFNSAAGFTTVMLLPTGVGQILAMLAMIGTAGIVAREHSQGTIKFLLIRSRSRTAILASKYATVLLYSLALLTTAILSLFIIGLLWFGAAGGNAGAGDIARSVLYVAVYALLYVTLTFMLSVLTSSTGVAIGASLFAVMLDKLIIQREFYKYMLFPNLDLSVYQGGEPPLPGMTQTFSVLVLAAYMILFILAAFTVFRRRDVA
ncbi:ABC transporter permease [Paenibacillus tepidiphilus]|uniref:ABC transporter permease n=1 Tax=Paenibacillus tepidiphilus TaxID=2608683 RepID=UPI0012390386|nr:DUF2705 family protein [Paenibacillus tepidiphilus]